MGPTPARPLAFAVLVLVAGAVRAQSPKFVPVTSLPPELVALAGTDALAALAVVPGAAIVALPGSDAQHSILRSSRAGQRREIEVSGRVVALALSTQGGAWAIVREVDRKGVERRSTLAVLDVDSGRPGHGVPLPLSAQGISLSADGRSILVAGADEVRTFRVPDLTSGPLYRVPGRNVGIGPTPWDERVWVIAQSERVGVVDLDQPQGREGLPLLRAAPAPVPLRSLPSWGDGSLVVVGITGDAWRVEIAPPDAAPPVVPPIPVPVPLPVPQNEPPLPPAAAETQTVPEPEPVPTPVPTPVPAPVEASAPPGSLSGLVTGPARGSIAQVVALGPDNVLKEAARVTPGGNGAYRFDGLMAGAYRIVAMGSAGRVLICDPPYLTVRLDGSQPVTVPELRAIRVP